MLSACQSARETLRNVPAPTSTASAVARSRPMTKRSGSLPPLISLPDSASVASATTPSIDDTKFAYSDGRATPKSPP